MATSRTSSSIKSGSAVALEHLSRQDRNSLLTGACKLQQVGMHDGPKIFLLRGKKLGLLCENDTAEDAVLFCDAALELGAHVSHIRPGLSELSTLLEVQDTARVLGRLYDAVECQGMSLAVVQQMGEVAGVPVYHGIASKTHSTARLTKLMKGGGSTREKRRFLIQAGLLHTMA